MNEFWHLMWDLSAVVGLACIAATVSTLLLLSIASRREQRHLSSLQREAFEPPTTPVQFPQRFLDSGAPCRTNGCNRLKIDGGRSQL